MYIWCWDQRGAWFILSNRDHSHMVSRSTLMGLPCSIHSRLCNQNIIVSTWHLWCHSDSHRHFCIVAVLHHHNGKIDLLILSKFENLVSGPLCNIFNTHTHNIISLSIMPHASKALQNLRSQAALAQSSRNLSTSQNPTQPSTPLQTPPSSVPIAPVISQIPQNILDTHSEGEREEVLKILICTYPYFHILS